MGYSPWGHKESDTTERLLFHFPPNHWQTTTCLLGEGSGQGLVPRLSTEHSVYFKLVFPSIFLMRHENFCHFLISLSLGPRLLFCFHTLCVTFPATSQQSVPMRVLICPEILSPSSGLSILGPSPFPVTPFLSSADTHSRCPGAGGCTSGMNVQTQPSASWGGCSASSACPHPVPEEQAQSRNRPQSRKDAQGHTAEANQSPGEHTRDWSELRSAWNQGAVGVLRYTRKQGNIQTLL